MIPVRDSSLSLWFAPRWTRRSVVLAAVVTVGLYLLLPALERFSAPPPALERLRPVETVRLPPPEPLPELPTAHSVPDADGTPRPMPPPWSEPSRLPVPQPMPVSLRMAIPLPVGDHRFDFRVTPADRATTVFDVADLDEPPRPLVRLKPLYPPQARMRNVEGSVTVEFIVGTDGQPRDIVVIDVDPDGGFAAAAVQAIARWRFTAGRREGTPVAARVRQTVNFNLR